MTENKSNPMRFPYFWHILATLKDNSVVNQETFWTPINLNKDNVKSLFLYYKGEPRGAIEIGPDQRLILIARVRAQLNQNIQEVGSRVYTFFVGWQKTVNGKNTKTVIELTPDGLMITRDYDPARMHERWQ
jgi:hypothetical protein